MELTTDFPGLFRSHWGWGDDVETFANIIANRNAFGRFLGPKGERRDPRDVEDREISLTYSQWTGDRLDHLEYYRDSEGRYIQVCSQYSADRHDKLTNEGWVVLKPMYALNATTYARYIDMTAIRAKRDIVLAQQEIENLRRDNAPSRQIETRRKRIEAFRLKDCAQKQKERATWLRNQFKE